MMEMKTAVLEDNKEYFVIDTIDIDGITYKLFSNIEDEKEIKIRKIIIEDNVEYISGIDNDEEIKNVILAFNKKINS